MSYCDIEVVGGGGAGGGAAATGAGQYSAGAGGGGGGYAKGTFTAAQIGTSQTVTIGAGGTGVSGGNGNSGGDTFVGSLVYAIGGFGGNFIPAAAQGQFYGGDSGNGVTGSILSNGSAGGAAFISTGLSLHLAGQGGSTSLGGASLGGASGGTAGYQYGGGGSGVSVTASSSAAAGLAGASGVAIITEYIYTPSGNVSALVWNPVSGTSQAAIGNNGYYTQNAALTTITLPSTGVPGTFIAISGVGAGGWKLAQNAGQSINFGNQVTTVGTGGSIGSNNQYDAIEVLVVNSTQFVVIYASGYLTVT